MAEHRIAPASVRVLMIDEPSQATAHERLQFRGPFRLLPQDKLHCRDGGGS